MLGNVGSVNEKYEEMLREMKMKADACCQFTRYSICMNSDLKTDLALSLLAVFK